MSFKIINYQILIQIKFGNIVMVVQGRKVVNKYFKLILQKAYKAEK